MGFWDTITDLAEAAMPWATVEAEAPAAEEKVSEAFFFFPLRAICCRALT